MKLTLTNGYPYPWPAGLSDEEYDAISDAAGSKFLEIHGVKHFEWLHTVTVELEDIYYLERATDDTGWESWDNGYVLEAQVSKGDGYDHPAIIAGDTAYCGFIVTER